METHRAAKYIDLNTYYIVLYFKLSNQRLKIVCKPWGEVIPILVLLPYIAFMFKKINKLLP